jgi:hypothetical protein
MYVSLSFPCSQFVIHDCQLEHVKTVQLTSCRIHAFALAEIAFVVSLTSADSGVSQAAAKGLRILAQTDSLTREKVSPGSDNDRESRNSIYEQLGDPNVVVVGTCRLSDCK